MRRFLSTLLILFLTFSSFSQCEGIQDVTWHFPNDTTLEIAFSAGNDVLAYEVDIIALYDEQLINPLSHTFSGNAENGANSVILDLDQVGWPWFFFSQPDNYYYEIRVRVQCQSFIWSADKRLYASMYSLLNDPGFEMSELHFNPITELPDGAGDSYTTTIVVPEDSIMTEIESISVFIDIGHTFNGDLQVEITNPYGVTVILQDWPSGFGGSSGYSVLFQDGATPIQDTDLPHGLYAPTEALSAFQGFPKAGVWTVTVTDFMSMDYGYLFGVGLYVNSTPCLASVSGKTYFDLNENGIQDGTEPGYSGAVIHNSLDDQFIFSNSQGAYMDCSTLGVGELELLELPMYYAPVSTTHPISLLEGDFLEDLDFPLQATVSVTDIEVDIFATGPFRPGFDNAYYIQYTNVGTECVDFMTIEVDVDPALDILSISNPNATIIGNTVILELTDFCPFDSGEFIIYINVPVSVPLSSTLTTIVATSAIANEGTQWNNEETLVSTVVNSYDPNDKQVDHTEISTDFISGYQKLEYMVRFQNTGTYMADRVVIIDSLSQFLNMNSLTLMSTTHDCVVSKIGNVAFFTFNDIFLPDSTTDLAGSQGFLRFEIEPQDGLSVGTVIQNKAEIYFDFNSAIITNTVETEVVMPSGLQDLELIQFSLRPNPAVDEIFIAWNSEANFKSIEIIDMQGRKVLYVPLKSSEAAWVQNISTLESGSYIIRLNGEKGISQRTFVKH